MFFGVFLVALVGCSQDKDSAGTAVDPGDPVDPAVNSYLPPGYVAKNPTRLILMGDSIAAGAGASSGMPGFTELLQSNDDSAWPDHGEIDLETTFPSISEVIDVSEYGATSSSLLSSQLPAVESAVGGWPASGETLIVVTIGGNDAQMALLPGANIDALIANGKANVETMVEWVQDPAHFPDGAFVYATNIYEPTNGDGQADGCFFGLDLSGPLTQLQPFNDELESVGREHGVAVLDLHGHFDAHGHNADDPSLPNHDSVDPTVWFAGDCIHPNDRGHHEIRRLFHAGMTGQPLLLEP